MDARIYKPSRTAMQSGHGNTGEWLLEYESDASRRPEPLMGWTAAGETIGQIRLWFKTREEAQDYARRIGLAFTVQPPQKRKVKPRNYTDNFIYRAEDEE